jgi:hypothetical protein
VKVTRAERVEQITALRAEGLTAREIGEILGITKSAVRNIICDPDGSKQRERRKRYQGVCINCGAPTDGANGYAKAPERCQACWSLYQSTLKVWTRETVLDAILRFAAKFGRPPTATEWLHVDRENNYPSCQSVYRSDSRSTSPFASWAEAIEAAGFPRPRQGQGPNEQWWDRDSIIVACRRWVAARGDIPTYHGDWQAARPGYPSATSVLYYFGTWNAMIAAAGFVPRAPGGRTRAKAEAA